MGSIITVKLLHAHEGCKVGESTLTWDLLLSRTISRESVTSSTWPSPLPFRRHLISCSPVPSLSYTVRITLSFIRYKNFTIRFTDYPGPEPVPEVAADVEMALGTGYGESKWICEEILAISRAEAGLQPVIIRIGQVSGGVNGYWKPSEWIPSIVQSVALTRCLPSSDQVSSYPA